MVVQKNSSKVFGQSYSQLRGVVFLLASLLLWGAPTSASAAGIQFYKINKKHQQVELFNVKGAREPGCHNFRFKKKIARAGQVGFDYCEVFSEKDCAPGSEYAFNWSGKRIKRYSKIKFPTQQIRPGNLWVIRTGIENHLVRSWRCVAE